MTEYPKVYLISRYSRAPQLRTARDELEAAGYRVVSRWIEGGHELTKEGSTEAHHAERMRFAMEDMGDLLAADQVVAFTEEPRATRTRGGRYVELGMALALGMPCSVVGWRENVFCCLPEIRFYAQWADCLAALEKEAADE